MNLDINKQVVAKRFGRQAAQYDEHAKVQKIMARRLLEKLDQEAPWTPKRILEIGCGTGYLTERLVQRYPEAELVAIDLSSAMLRVAQDKIGLSHPTVQIKWIEADAEQFVDEPGDPWDLIISNATFQWFQQPLQTARAYRERLAEDGMFLFATFGPDTFTELHHAFGEAEQALYGMERNRHGQPFVSLDEWKQALSNNNQVVSAEEHYEIERYEDVRAFLRSIQKIGATHAAKDTGSNRTSRSLLLKMIEEYDRMYRKKDEYSGGSYVPATYHCLYVYTMIKKFY